jgi:hypothetical protein
MEAPNRVVQLGFSGRDYKRPRTPGEFAPTPWGTFTAGRAYSPSGCVCSGFLMRRSLCAVLIGAACLAPVSALAQDAAADEFDPATIDLAKLIECRTYDVPSYNALAFWLVGDEAAQARAQFGLTEEKTANFMLKAYALKAPITVFGRQTRHIVFNSSGPMAVLDEADPHPLARELKIEPAIDVPAKFLGEREIATTTDKGEAGGFTYKTRVTLNVSTVTSHPGKTLAGCSYTFEMIENAQ